MKLKKQRGRRNRIVRLPKFSPSFTTDSNSDHDGSPAQQDKQPIAHRTRQRTNGNPQNADVPRKVSAKSNTSTPVRAVDDQSEDVVVNESAPRAPLREHQNPSSDRSASVSTGVELVSQPEDRLRIRLPEIRPDKLGLPSAPFDIQMWMSSPPASEIGEGVNANDADRTTSTERSEGEGATRRAVSMPCITSEEPFKCSPKAVSEPFIQPNQLWDIECVLRQDIPIGSAAPETDEDVRGTAGRSHVRDKPLVGRFLIGLELGRGGNGQVFKRIDIKEGKACAIKRSRNLFTHGDPNLVESIILSNLKHPLIVGWLATMKEENFYFVAMEFLSGPTLEKFVESFKYRMDEDVARRLFYDITRGLQFLHDLGCCHTDLKPANLMLGARGEVKLLYFSLAVWNCDSRLLKCKLTTPYYAPPEFRNDDVDGFDAKKVDMWQLGLCLYMMLTHRSWKFVRNRPYKLSLKKGGELKVPGHISADVKKALLQTLVHDPSKRTSCSDILASDWLRHPETFGKRQFSKKCFVPGTEEYAEVCLAVREGIKRDARKYKFQKSPVEDLRDF